MSREPLALAFREKSESVFTPDSSDLSVPSTSSLASIPTLPALLFMNPVIRVHLLPTSFRNFETVFRERATPGRSSETKLSP